MAATINSKDNRNWSVGSAGPTFAGPNIVCVTVKRLMNPYTPDTTASKKKKIAPTICIWLLHFFTHAVTSSSIIGDRRPPSHFGKRLDYDLSVEALMFSEHR